MGFDLLYLASFAANVDGPFKQRCKVATIQRSTRNSRELLEIRQRCDTIPSIASPFPSQDMALGRERGGRAIEARRYLLPFPVLSRIGAARCPRTVPNWRPFFGGRRDVHRLKLQSCRRYAPPLGRSRGCRASVVAGRNGRSVARTLFVSAMSRRRTLLGSFAYHWGKS